MKKERRVIREMQKKVVVVATPELMLNTNDK